MYSMKAILVMCTGYTRSRYMRTLQDTDGWEVKLTTMSLQPLSFMIDGLLSAEDCRSVVHKAETDNVMKNHIMINGEKIINSARSSSHGVLKQHGKPAVSFHKNMKILPLKMTILPLKMTSQVHWHGNLNKQSRPPHLGFQELSEKSLVAPGVYQEDGEAGAPLCTETDRSWRVAAGQSVLAGREVLEPR